MSQKEEIKKFVWSFINPKNEECGWIEFTEENTKQLESLKQQGYEFDYDSISNDKDDFFKDGLDAVLWLAEEKFGVKFEYEDVADYRSCGYDMDSYAWACITKDGELYFDTAMHERY